MRNEFVYHATRARQMVYGHGLRILILAEDQVINEINKSLDLFTEPTESKTQTLYDRHET